MTFNNDLYALETYQRVPFIIESEGPTFAEILPGLINPHYVLSKKLKPLYHAFCMISGNFTCLLWERFFSELEQTFSLPKSVAYTYLEQIFHNLRYSDESALTGPLVRGDKKIIKAHLDALKDDAYKNIYQAFVDAYQQST